MRCLLHNRLEACYKIMDYRAFLFTCILLSLLISSQAKLNIELNNFSCIAIAPELAHEFSCTLHRKSIQPKLSVQFNLKEPGVHFYLIFNIAMIKKDNSKMTVGRHRLDGCKFLESFYAQVGFFKFFKRIRAASNLPKKCPIPANKLFEIRNYTVLAEEYPPGIPAMTYEWGLKIELNERIIAHVYVLGTTTYT